MTLRRRARSVARMERRENLDAFGLISLIGFSALLGFNQVVIKFVNEGLQPVFMAGIRSFGAMIILYLWMRWIGLRPVFARAVWWSGLLSGTLFAGEFILLFVALDLTTVARTSVMFYTMPVWFALLAHFVVPGERLNGLKILGLALAVAGVALALLTRPGAGQGSIAGDIMALVGSFGWAGIAIIARATAFAGVAPMMQMYWQLSVSAVILLIAAPFFGPFVRDFQPEHYFGVAFQIVIVGAGVFLFWFWLLKRYPAGAVTSFSFLAPIFGVVFGWLLLDETVGMSLIGALALVCLGLVLINRPRRA